MTATMWARASWMVLAFAAAAPTMAAAAEEGVGEVEQVVVTARKRQETDIAVPVSVSSLSAQQIERQAIANMYDVALRTPGLSVTNNTSGGGGSQFLRGIGTSATISSTLEQSISLSLDGAPTSRGNALRIGLYDLQQIEVLKGPQALFFGKNSPAGVISLRSKDPTDSFDALVKLSYEPYADGRFVEAAISGPFTEALKGRLFVHIGDQSGAVDNRSALALAANAIRPNTVIPNDRHAWNYGEKFVRGTLVFEPNDRFRARLMSSYLELDGDGSGVFRERYYCPRGVAQMTTTAAVLGAGPNIAPLAAALAVDDCKLNSTIYKGGISAANLSAPASFTRDPQGAARSRLGVSVADWTYKITDNIDFTSVSALLRLSDRGIESFAWSPADVGALTFYNRVLQSQFTQEVRVTSNFEGPLNLMVGGFYEDSFFETFASSTATPPYNIFQFHVPNKIYSGFAQGLWKITPEIEVAAGVRYTREKKSLELTRDGVRQPTANPEVTFRDTSPEATLTWRPTSDLTAYVAYKSGFKSGGYGATISGNGPALPAAPLRNFLFRPEEAEGFEAGVKSQLFDRTLRLDATVYGYDYSNLQVANAEVSTGVPVQRVLNAATAKQRGAEVEAVYYPPQISGLRLTGTVNYNRARYPQFISPCFIGQSIAEGCNLAPAANGAFTSQDLKGRRLTNAPLWTGAAGFTYARPVGDLRLEFGADVIYRSSFNAIADLSPGARQKAYAVLSGQVRLISPSGGWELGVHAKNLTDVQRALDTSQVPLTGTAATTCTANGGVLGRADLAGNTNPARAIFIQLVLRPGEWMRR